MMNIEMREKRSLWLELVWSALAMREGLFDVVAVEFAVLDRRLMATIAGVTS